MSITTRRKDSMKNTHEYNAEKKRLNVEKKRHNVKKKRLNEEHS
jgi:hypothetical protein